MIEAFYMVLSDMSDFTRYRHDTFKKAKIESERLARENPGTKFFVLKCVGYSMKNDPVDWVEVDEIPF